VSTAFGPSLSKIAPTEEKHFAIRGSSAEWQWILQTARPALLVALGYYVGTRVGFLMTPRGAPNSTFWPANAILVASFLSTPRRLWWTLVVSVLGAHLCAQLPSGVPLWTALGWFVTNTAEGLIAAFCITRFTSKESLFSSVRGVLAFVVFGVLFAPLATSFLDAASVVITGWGSGYWPLGEERFWTNALAELTVVPLIVLAADGISWIRNADSVRRWEAAVLAISTIVISVCVFRFEFGSAATTPAALYFPLPLLLWAAVRFQVGGLSASLLCMDLIAMWCTIHGHLPFPYASMWHNVVALQILFCMAAVPVMFLSAVMDEARRTQQSLRSVSAKLMQAQEQERSRIGRELHDDINQRLAMLALEIEELENSPANVQTGLQELRKQTLEISDDVQALSHDLHSTKLEYLGMAPGMKSWCREFGERYKMEIKFTGDVPNGLPADVGRSLFRVLQESLHNAHKHSATNQIDVQLAAREGQLHLIIRDAGKGFDVEQAKRGKGLGLTSMQERVRLVNGTIEIESQPMRGTTIHARVPLGDTGWLGMAG